jgi:hypothetical protein
MRTGGSVDPAVIVSSNAPAVVAGLALVSVVAKGRVRVSEVIDLAKVPPLTTSGRECPSATPGQQCAVGKVVCESLVVQVQALCPAGDLTAATLPTCEFDLLLLTPTSAAPTPVPGTDAGVGGESGANDAGLIDAGPP